MGDRDWKVVKPTLSVFRSQDMTDHCMFLSETVVVLYVTICYTDPCIDRSSQQTLATEVQSGISQGN